MSCRRLATPFIPPVLITTPTRTSGHGSLRQRQQDHITVASPSTLDRVDTMRQSEFDWKSTRTEPSPIILPAEDTTSHMTRTALTQQTEFEHPMSVAMDAEPERTSNIDQSFANRPGLVGNHANPLESPETMSLDELLPQANQDGKCVETSSTTNKFVAYSMGTGPEQSASDGDRWTEPYQSLSALAARSHLQTDRGVTARDEPASYLLPLLPPRFETFCEKSGDWPRPRADSEKNTQDTVDRDDPLVSNQNRPSASERRRRPTGYCLNTSVRKAIQRPIQAPTITAKPRHCSILAFGERSRLSKLHRAEFSLRLTNPWIRVEPVRKSNKGNGAGVENNGSPPELQQQGNTPIHVDHAAPCFREVANTSCRNEPPAAFNGSHYDGDNEVGPAVTPTPFWEVSLRSNKKLQKKAAGPSCVRKKVIGPDDHLQVSPMGVFLRGGSGLPAGHDALNGHINGDTPGPANLEPVVPQNGQPADATGVPIVTGHLVPHVPQSDQPAHVDGVPMARGNWDPRVSRYGQPTDYNIAGPSNWGPRVPRNGQPAHVNGIRMTNGTSSSSANSYDSRVDSLADSQTDEDEWVIDWWLCEPLGRTASNESYSESVDSLIARQHFRRESSTYSTDFDSETANTGSILFPPPPNSLLSRVPYLDPGPSSNVWPPNPGPPDLPPRQVMPPQVPNADTANAPPARNRRRRERFVSRLRETWQGVRRIELRLRRVVFKRR